jgi:tetratricopeptide (TPR) repeat protein
MHTRTRLITMLVLVAGTRAVGTQPSDGNASWVSQRVLPTKSPEEIKFWNHVEGKNVNAPFDSAGPLKVRDDRDGKLRVHNGRREGWVNKADFVLVRDAIERFSPRVQTNAGDTWARYMRAMAWLEKHELDKAIKDLDECIRLDPTNPRVFNSRGYALNQRKEYDKAIRDFDDAIRLNPKFVRAFYGRAIVWFSKGDFDKAMKEFDEAVRRDPEYVRGFFGRAALWIEKGDFDKAIQDYDEAIRLDSRCFEALNDRGKVWLDKKEYEKAIRDFNVALQIDPKFAGGFYNRGSALLGKKEYASANPSASIQSSLMHSVSEAMPGLQ